MMRQYRARIGSVSDALGVRVELGEDLGTKELSNEPGHEVGAERRLFCANFAVTHVWEEYELGELSLGSNFSGG